MDFNLDSRQTRNSVHKKYVT